MIPPMGIREGPVIRRAGDAPACPGIEALQSQTHLHLRGENMSTTGTNGMPRRSFITTTALAGVGASLAAAGSARAAGKALPAGDVAILRLLAAAELIEADLWQQIAELANNNPAYQKALQNIDPA